jgi:hypothetical protein
MYPVKPPNNLGSTNMTVGQLRTAVNAAKVTLGVKDGSKVVFVDKTGKERKLNLVRWTVGERGRFVLHGG